MRIFIYLCVTCFPHQRFTVDLLEFVSSRHQDLVTASMFPTESSQQGELALTSLAHVIRNNAGVEMQTIGHFKMIFSLLESHFSSVQETAMSVIRYAELIGQQCEYLTLIGQSPQLRDWQRGCCLGYRRHKLSWKTALLSTRHVSHLKTCHSGHLVCCLQQHQDCQRSV